MADKIHETDDTFDFSKLVLTKPTPISGGNFFTRLLCGGSHLYIQAPKCVTKQGILKTGKKFYTDFVFTNENEVFIRWMENLENFCQKKLFENRENWFEGSVEMTDIENYFTAPVKVYKSGKLYSVRANINTNLDGKPAIHIYDEHENDVDIEAIADNTRLMSILEITGIKCSLRSFQIEIEIKQIMVLKPTGNLFEKRLLLSPKEPAEPPVPVPVPTPTPTPTPTPHVKSSIQSNEKPIDFVPENIMKIDNADNDNLGKTPDTKTVQNPIPPYLEKMVENGLQEVDFHLDEIVPDDVVQIKQRNAVYYNLYKEAKRKAKIARDLALSAYLEAKHIKNKYALEDTESDEEEEEEEEEEGEEEEEEEGEEEENEDQTILGSL